MIILVGLIFIVIFLIGSYLYYVNFMNNDVALQPDVVSQQTQPVVSQQTQPVVSQDVTNVAPVASQQMQQTQPDVVSQQEINEVDSQLNLGPNVNRTILNCSENGLEFARTYYDTLWQGNEKMDPLGGVESDVNTCDIKFRVIRSDVDPVYDYRQFKFTFDDKWVVSEMGQKNSGYLAKSL